MSWSYVEIHKFKLFVVHLKESIVSHRLQIFSHTNAFSLRDFIQLHELIADRMIEHNNR